MTQKKPQNRTKTALRLDAEAAMREHPVNDNTLKHEDMEHLIHELQVHQVELELQNEDLKRSQDALEVQRQMFSDLYNFAPVGYLTVDEAGVILQANLTSAAMLSTSVEVLLKHPLYDLIARDDQDAYYLHQQALFRTRQPQDWETTLIKGDGTAFRAKLQTIVTEGSKDSPICGYVAIIDIEQQRLALAKIEQANRLKSVFLAMISHELRTPLTSIKGFATTLLQPNVKWNKKTQIDFLQTINQEADNLTELVEQLLDASRLQVGALPVRPEPETVNALIEAAHSRLMTLTAQHELRLSIPERIPPVMADLQRCVQVLVNLVENAVKHSPVGTSIQISAAQAGAYVQLEVSDEGEGIALENRESVFDPFQQGETKVLQSLSGAGLGLTICKGLIEAHEGRIWIQDQEMKGTTIAFTLPIVPISG